MTAAAAFVRRLPTPGENLLPLADTHCHLDFQAFNGDRSEVIKRAALSGINRILNPGVDLPSSREAVRLAAEYEPVYAAVGIHPNDALTWNDSTLNDLRELARSPKTVAIGEIGLDYYRDRAPKVNQQQVFRQQLALAEELGLPVIIHNREASQDLLSLLEEWCAGLSKNGSHLAGRPGVLHSFSADDEIARRAIALGFSIGITGPVTFKNAATQQNLVSSLPLPALLLETDSPFLAPHPHRGQRNEPAQVRLIADKIASLHDLPVEVIAETTSANARRLFLW